MIARITLLASLAGCFGRSVNDDRGRIPYSAGDTRETNRVTDGLIALYTFDLIGDVVTDESQVEPLVDLLLPPPDRINWTEEGLELSSVSTVLGSNDPPEKIFDRCTANNAISVEAWVRPADTAQGGPARIVAFSGGTAAHNFLLGQGGINAGSCEPFGAAPNLAVRIRTANNPDAHGCPALTSHNVLTTEWVHIVFTADDSSRHMYVDAQLHVSNPGLGGPFSNWDPSHRLILGNELSLNRQWLGTFELVAIYDRMLSADEVGQNFDAGPDGE